MKRRKIALLLAMTLTLTQGMGVTVPVAAEELPTGEGLEQEIVPDGGDEATEVLDDEAGADVPEGVDAATDMDLLAVQNAG